MKKNKSDYGTILTLWILYRFEGGKGDGVEDAGGIRTYSITP